MYRTTARVLAVVVGLLGLVGIFIEGDHLLGIMNVDIALDILRLVLAVALAVVGFGRASQRAARSVLAVVGILYVLLGGMAIADPEVFGLLPTGFTGFDIAFHLVVGLGTLAVVAMAPRELAKTKS